MPPFPEAAASLRLLRGFLVSLRNSHSTSIILVRLLLGDSGQILNSFAFCFASIGAMLDSSLLHRTRHEEKKKKNMFFFCLFHDESTPPSANKPRNPNPGVRLPSFAVRNYHYRPHPRRITVGQHGHLIAFLDTSDHVLKLTMANCWTRITDCGAPPQSCSLRLVPHEQITPCTLAEIAHQLGSRTASGILLAFLAHRRGKLVFLLRFKAKPLCV
ncbi:hypothetical protein BJX64DRAFT_148419 [Aspergillus heterothallicus]